MYVHIKSEPELWTVGHFGPDAKWIADSDHPTEDSAARRVRYLNGGGNDMELVAALREALAWMIAVAAMQGASLPSSALDFSDAVTKCSKQTPWGAVKSAIAKLEAAK